MSDKSYIAFLELNKEAANNAILGVYINLFDELNKVDISEANKIMDTIKMHHTNMKKINELFDDAIKNEQTKTETANKKECCFCKEIAVCRYFGGNFFCNTCEYAGGRFIRNSGFPF
jgi:hypothetical protein